MKLARDVIPVAAGGAWVQLVPAGSYDLLFVENKSATETLALDWVSGGTVADEYDANAGVTIAAAELLDYVGQFSLPNGLYAKNSNLASINVVVQYIRSDY